MKESLKINESLIMNGKKLTVNNKASGRIIGEVVVEEFDKYGNNIFSETTYNDVSLPGSIFVLEQIFKKASNSGYRFLHSNKVPIRTFSDPKTGEMTSVDGSSKWNDIASDNLDEYISDEYIFGFMVGHGGETSTSIVAPKYESSTLANSNNTSSFLPFRIVDTGEFDPVDDGINYYIKYTDTDSGDKEGGRKYFYAKGFTTEPKIYTKWADGTGNVESEQLNYDVPILTYAEVVLDIDELDIREFFSASNSEECYINQLGLVAGKPIWVRDPEGTYIKDGDGSYKAVSSDVEKEDRYRLDFDDVKLVTTLNFKSKDLSNDENKIKFTYKVYCL